MYGLKLASSEIQKLAVSRLGRDESHGSSLEFFVWIIIFLSVWGEEEESTSFLSWNRKYPCEHLNDFHFDFFRE